MRILVFVPGTGLSVYAHYRLWFLAVPGDQDSLYLSFADKKTEAHGGCHNSVERAGRNLRLALLSLLEWSRSPLGAGVGSVTSTHYLLRPPNS